MLLNRFETQLILNMFFHPPNSQFRSAILKTLQKLLNSLLIFITTISTRKIHMKLHQDFNEVFIQFTISRFERK